VSLPGARAIAAAAPERFLCFIQDLHLKLRVAVAETAADTLGGGEVEHR